MPSQNPFDFFVFLGRLGWRLGTEVHDAYETVTKVVGEVGTEVLPFMEERWFPPNPCLASPQICTPPNLAPPNPNTVY
jgi:hypothetical protein